MRTAVTPPALIGDVVEFERSSGGVWDDVPKFPRFAVSDEAAAASTASFIAGSGVLPYAAPTVGPAGGGFGGFAGTVEGGTVGALARPSAGVADLPDQLESSGGQIRESCSPTARQTASAVERRTVEYSRLRIALMRRSSSPAASAIRTISAPVATRGPKEAGASGVVSKQSPAAGEFADEGSAVSLIVDSDP